VREAVFILTDHDIGISSPQLPGLVARDGLSAREVVLTG